MPLNLVYPSPATMTQILPDLLSRDRADRVGLQLFPIVSSESYFVRWAQRDNAYGLMQMRGLDGQPPRVQRVGTTTFVYEPGVYGEHVVITEREILTRAAPTNLEIPIPVGDLVTEADQLLITRENDRMEANVWNLIGTGTLSIPLPGPNGVNVYQDTYAIQTYTAPVPWATSATSTPIQNFQTVQQLQLGHGASFGADATAYMNQYTANLLMNNNNNNDFGGRRSAIGSTLNSIGSFSDYFQGQNLPKVQVYDAGYQLSALSGTITNASTQYQKFIPNGRVIVVGKRPGNQPVGEWKQTIQAMNPGGTPTPGPYRFIKDYSRGINCALEVPPKLEVHRGFNGGVVLYWPSAIIAMSV